MKTTKEKLLNAAIDEFSRYGLDGARIDRIAKRARINKAMIYYHFPGKEALYVSIIQELGQTIVDTILANIAKVQETGNPLIIIEAYANHISNLDRRYFMIIMRELAGGGKYIKNIIAPTIIEPMTHLIGNIFEAGKDKSINPGLHPQYTMISVAGAVIFYNLMRQILQGTSLHANYFSDNHVNEYIANLLSLMSYGIIKEDI